MKRTGLSSQSVAVVTPSWSSFVETDARILSQAYDVTRVAWQTRRSSGELKRAIRRSSAVISWFAGDHALIAALLARRWRKPAILVAGGADVANMPEIRYGAMAGPLRARLATRLSLRFSDLVATFSEFAKREILRIHTPKRLEVVPLGVDASRFSPLGRKENTVATVGYISQTNLLRKGHLTFLEAARLLPEAKFVLAGVPKDRSVELLRKEAPANLELLLSASDEELLALYRRAKVYVQASAHEAFGLAVAEAMATGCIPVVTRRGSLPEVVGDTGKYVSLQDPVMTAKAIRQALGLSDTAGSAARQRIIEKFTVDRRAATLIHLVGETIREKQAK